MKVGRLFLSTLLWLPLACGEDPDADADTDACEDGDEPAHILVKNQTGNAFEEIVMRACDASDEQSYPFPPPGLANGDERLIELPAPGCWMLTYSGEGCVTYQPFEVEACAGETVDWVASNDNHICAG